MYGADARTPGRASGLLAAIGGGCIVASVFLPNYLVTNPSATPPYSASDYHVATLWESISASLFGTSAFSLQSNGYVAVQPHIFSIIVSTAPYLMAIVIMLLGAWAIVQRPRAGRSAVLSAAVVIVALSSVSTLLNASIGAYAIANSSYTVSIEAPLLSLGSAVFLLGVFITLIAGFLGWQSAKAY